jgi:hypothetical protein
MDKRLKYAILAIALIQIFMILGLLAIPPVAQTLPGEIRVRLARLTLGEMLLDLGVTPMPTALRAPSGAIAQSKISIPSINILTPTPGVTATVPAASFKIAPAKESIRSVQPTLVPTSTATPTAMPTPVPLPGQAQIDGVKIIAQGFNNCGPANLTINLDFYGNETTQAEAAAFLKPNREDRNVSPWQMADYVNEQTDLRAFVGSGGDLELIKHLVAAGFPVVIEKGYELPREGWLGHYLTIFGYDDEEEEMISLDTNLGPWDGSGRYDSYDDIEKYWQQFNYTFFVVYPPDKEQQVYGILGSGMVEETTMWQQATKKAQVEIDVDPQNAFAWFNLGSSLTRLGELTGEGDFYANGAAAFDQAFILGVPPRIVWYQFRPYIAYLKVARYQDMVDLADTTLGTQGGRNVEETYLYKGHAFAFLDDGVGAVEAYKQALKLNENFYPAQWALNSILAET